MDGLHGPCWRSRACSWPWLGQPTTDRSLPAKQYRSVRNRWVRFEGDEGFDVGGLREEVDALDALQDVAVVGQDAQVASQGGRVAGEVDDPPGLERDQPLDGRRGQPRSGRVEYDDGGPMPVACREHLLDAALDDLDVVTARRPKIRAQVGNGASA